MLSSEELEIAKRAKELGKSPEEALAGIAKYRASKTQSTTTPEQKPSAMQTAKDLGIGFVKGAGSTVKGLTDIGRPVTDRLLGALDPTKTIQDYQNIQSPSFLSEERLKSDNTTQKVGKGIEFVAEMLFPAERVAKAVGFTEKGGKVAGATLKGLGTKISGIGDDVVEGGVKVKDKLYQLIGNLDSKTRNALNKTTQEEFETMRKVGEKAMEADGNITPYEVVGNKIIDGLKQIQDRAGSVGAAKSRIMEQAKVGYQKVGNIAQKKALDIQKMFSGVKLDPSDAKIVKNFQDTLMKLGNNPQLKDVDAAIDLLQDQLYKSTRSNAVEVTDRVVGPLRKAIGELNGQVKTLGGEAYGKLNQEYADISAIVKELNARLGKEGSSAGALVKRLFSPSDARTKELFKELQKLTGQDYFKDARLAKFVMEALDDPRAKSLLEELPTPTGIVRDIYQYGKRKLDIPLKAAESIIRNR